MTPRPAAGHHGAGGGGRADRGMSESVSWAVVMPVLLVCVLGLIQLGLWLHGQNTARSAAATGADLAALDGAATTAEQGALAVASAGGLEDAHVTVSGSADAVVVDVTATVPLVFDLGQGRVHATSRTPRERVSRP